MTGIPLPLATDAEDVVWALQTADALWKRGETDEAVIWLRRSAQAAGAAEDDERALLLARAAAEMADALRTISDRARGVAPSVPAEQVRAATGVFQPAAEYLDVDDADVDLEELDSATVSSAPELPEEAPVARESRPSFRFRAYSSPETPTAVRISPDRDIPTPIRTTVVPDAAYLSVGYEAAMAYVPFPGEAGGGANEGESPLLLDLEEVDSVPSIRSVVGVREEPESPGEAEPFPLISSAHIPAAMPTTPTLDPPVELTTDERHATPDLSAVEAFGDLPDDVREEFARAANVRRLGPHGQIGGVALALVLQGTVKIVGAKEFPPISAGGVVRLREDPDMTSTTEIRAVSSSAVVASWGPEAVAMAFSECPWVDDDLRAADDHLP